MKRECLLHLFCCTFCEVQGLKLKAVRKSCGMKGIESQENMYGGAIVDQSDSSWELTGRKQNADESIRQPGSIWIVQDNPAPKKLLNTGVLHFKKHTCFFVFLVNHILKPPLKLNDDRMSGVVWK